MRLIQRSRHHHPHRKPRIEITEAEISADLHYPAPPPSPRRTANARRPAVR